MSLTERLNKILPEITSTDFLKGKGLGNEIAFYIFDYLPEDEVKMRKHILFLRNRISRQHSDINLLHINLLELIINYLKNRDILKRSFTLEQDKGSSTLLNALKAPLKAENLAKLIKNKLDENNYDLVLIDGIGSVWPLVRTHSLLNNLQPVMGNIPLILFYPGIYDGHVLKLFGRLSSKNYYRAFRLVS